MRRTLQLWNLKLVIFYLPFLILPFFCIYLFRKLHVSSLNGWKVWILKDPILVPQILSSLIFPSYLLVYPKIVMCLDYTTIKFEVWHLCLRRTPHCSTLNFTNFFSCLPILKIPSVQRKWLKFKYWRESHHFGTPKFCQILSFLHSFLFWKIHVSSMSD